MTMWSTVFRWWKCSNRWLKWKMNTKTYTKTSKKCNNYKRRWRPRCNISCAACGKRLKYWKSGSNHALNHCHHLDRNRPHHRRDTAKFAMQMIRIQRIIPTKKNQIGNQNENPNFELKGRILSIEFWLNPETLFFYQVYNKIIVMWTAFVCFKFAKFSFSLLFYGKRFNEINSITCWLFCPIWNNVFVAKHKVIQLISVCVEVRFSKLKIESSITKR